MDAVPTRVLGGADRHGDRERLHPRLAQLAVPRSGDGGGKVLGRRGRLRLGRRRELRDIGLLLLAAPGEQRRGGEQDEEGERPGRGHRASVAEPASRPARPTIIVGMEGGDPFGLFGDPDELRARLSDMAEQMQGAQKVAWADNAIKLAVDMTVAAINTLDLSGSSDEQAAQVRDAIRIVFPEAVTLVREAREGLS